MIDIKEQGIPLDFRKYLENNNLLNGLHIYSLTQNHINNILICLK
jgi:hypothetical protein